MSVDSLRQPVALDKAYRLLNHGPTVLVSAAHDGHRDVMAAAWAMPLDFQPGKVAVVLDKISYTRSLLEASGCFALQVPVVAQAALVEAVGSSSGQALLDDEGLDKFQAYGIDALAGSALPELPLVPGCAAWLECRLLPEPHIQQRYDLFLGEIVGAQADSRVFSAGRWHFEGQDALRTLHHVAGGHFIVAGAALDAQPMARVR